MIEGLSESYRSVTLGPVHVSTATCNLSLRKNTDRQQNVRHNNYYMY